ncbi:hypothetical protein BC937DRAFT_88281 [Endogone sp. FLAS-F59071]|nr:hypothetical protein BC937DRAFT_88281 [Endogone sp. FLAS-F59071]|eukprot:RUS23318.1 hypothetical protein BC937DRAFT_88281 [Endogone sp. FLAS-F59071]
MPPKFRLTEKLRECLYYPDYWDRDPNLWGDVVDWDIYFAKKMPSCTPRDSHRALAIDLDTILEELPIDNFAYKKTSVLRATLKVKCLFETINDKISNVAMHATANAAEEEFTKEYSCNSKRESSALDDEEHDSNDEEIAIAQVEHGFENVCSRASISCDSDVLGIREEIVNNEMKKAQKTRAKRSRYEKPGTQEASAEISASKKARREQRCAGMDQSRFWVLRSGRSVEEILQKACLQEGATIKMRSFTIDFSCAVTKNLFSEDEWEEIMEKNVFELPELPPSTTSFLLRMKKALVKGNPACQVPLPDIDEFACTLVQDSCKIWQRLYSKTPSPFSVNDLSEAFWARKSWPLLTEFLDDMDDLFMIDGEKSGIESGKRRNSNRRYHPDTQTPRKQVGRKLDLVVRDVVEKKDYMIVERMKDWDEYSNKFLKETGVDLFRETHTIMMHRLQDTRNEELWDKGRFFGIYTGSCGFQTFELRPAGGRSYVSLFHEYPIYQLPTSIQDMRPQIQALTHLLQVRQLMSDTITLSRTSPVKTFKDEGDGEEEEDSSWIYGSTYTRLDASINIASSPPDPE